MVSSGKCNVKPLIGCWDMFSRTHLRHPTEHTCKTWRRWIGPSSCISPDTARGHELLTKYRRATPPATNQNKTIKPDIPSINIHVLESRWSDSYRNHLRWWTTHSQLRLAHHKVNRKKAARTSEAILLALVSKPQAMRAAPMRPEPRYPAGRVNQGIPPDIRVAPPSSATVEHVQHLTKRPGHCSTYELARSSVYARKWGLDMDVELFMKWNWGVWEKPLTSHECMAHLRIPILQVSNSLECTQYRDIHLMEPYSQ